MTIVLVLVSLALTAVARFVSDGKDCARSRPSLPASVGLLVAALLVGALALKYGQSSYRLALGTGIGLGALAIYVSELLGGKVAPIGVGVTTAALFHFLPPVSIAEGQFAMMAGLSVGSICLASRSGFATTLVAVGCAAADFLGAGHKNVPASISMGIILGLAGLIGIIGLGLLPKKFAAVQSLGIGIVVAAAGFVVSTRIVEPHVAIVVGMAALAGVVVHLLVPEDERDVMRIIIAGIIAMSVATIAYSYYRNAGVAASLITMLAVLLGSGNRTGVLAISLVFGLILLRLLQRADAAYPQSLDIGQHFILLGLFLGALIPFLPIDRVVRPDWRGGLTSVLWAVLLISSCIFVEVMLGHRGINGFVAGFALLGLISALRPQQSLQPLAIAPGLVAVSVFCLDQFNDWTELSKDEKVKFFLIAGSLAIALAAAIGLLSRTPKTEVTA